MGRGPESQASKMEKALRLAAETLGVTIESLKPMVAESEEDKMFEAQSVLNWFERAQDFKIIPCRNCGLKFAYDWYFDGIKYCSVHCIRIALQEQGLDWDPTREPLRRWGVSRPAFVPGTLLTLLSKLDSDSQSNHEHSKADEQDL